MSEGERAIEREGLVRGLEAHQLELMEQNSHLRETYLKLEEAASRYADLYDFAPVAYCTVSPQGVVLEANLGSARLFGTERSALVGRSLLTLVQSRDAGLVVEHLRRCVTEPDVRSEMTLNDSTTLIEMISSSMREPEQGFRTVLTDITNRKQAEEALRSSVRMRQDFLAIVSHDLRNPLNTILMGAELLLRRSPTTERRTVGRKQLESIKIASRRMTRLLADLLDLSSMDAGHLSIDSQRHDVSELLDSTLELAAPLAAEKSLRLMPLPLERPLVARCDRERTIQAMLNLLTNAVKFTPTGGTITIEAHPHPEGIVLAVRDSGVGISAEQLPNLFRPYWQADKTVRIGTGLGLSIAKGIIECHGGHIWAESTRGVGSAFFFTLPASELAAEPRVEKPIITFAPRLTVHAPLLLVDDEEAPREALTDLLQAEGYRVATATNGHEALELLSTIKPFVVLLDLSMPEMNGVQFLEVRKRDPMLSEVPVILLSGEASAATAEQYPKTLWVQKPVGMSELLEVINAEAERQGQQRATRIAGPRSAVMQGL